MQQNTSVQVWVKIFGLSQEYWHKTILFTIAGSLGTPICIDAVTAKPMHERTFGQFARVLVEIDLLHPLRYKLFVERKGFAFFVDLEYEHIPAFCSECKMIGHSFENCKRWNVVEELKNNKEKSMKHKAPEKKKIYVQTNDGRIQQGQPIEIVNVETEVVNVEEQISTPQNTIVGINNNVTNSASKTSELVIQDTSVHVEKQPVNSSQNIIVGNNNNVSNSVSNLQVAVPHMQPHILSPVSPQELLRRQDKQLENELNADYEGSWDTDSQGSFVETTQLDAAGVQNKELVIYTQGNSPLIPAGIRHEKTVTTVPMGGETSTAEANQIPDRVVSDMAFLKESWANMTEADAAFQNIEDTNHIVDSADQGFQIHMSKHQKKAQKTVKSSSRDSYATRSKVPPKPFR
jgi:hypothetical protein